MPDNLPSYILSTLRDVPLLDESNYYIWIEAMKMFFLSADVDWMEGAAVPADAEKAAMDKRLVGLIYGRISMPFRFLVSDKVSGLAAWKALKARFEKSTMARRIKARTDFDQVAHDPEQPIDLYIHAVEAARQALTGLGITIDDTHLKDVLLRNLDSSYDTVRTSILSSATEPTLDNIKATLSSSASALFIKSEPVTLANAARGASGYGRGKGYVSGGGRRGGEDHGHPIDSKGFHWCNPSNTGCHRCGHSGHVAHMCIFDMPSEVKDWVMGHAHWDAHLVQEEGTQVAGEWSPLEVIHV